MCHLALVSADEMAGFVPAHVHMRRVVSFRNTGCNTRAGLRNRMWHTSRNAVSSVSSLVLRCHSFTARKGVHTCHAASLDTSKSCDKDQTSWLSAVAVCTAGTFLVVGGAAHAREESAVPAYSPDRSRYDGVKFGCEKYGLSDAYLSRVFNMQLLIDPSTSMRDFWDLCTGGDTGRKTLERSQALLASFDPKKTYTDAENTAFWEAKKQVDHRVHPVTGEILFLPGRLSAFIPTNMPVAAGMLIHGPTGPAAAAFWQWMNQSCNAACNYANRSGAEIDTGKILQSYALAVGVSMAMAVIMGKIVKANPFLQTLGLFVPYFSVCCASTANMGFTRMEEMRVGVPVYDGDGNKLGLSPKAGKEGLWQTLYTRGWLTPMPILVFPPIMMIAVRSLVSGFALKTAAEIASITGCMYFALPLTLGIQPQTMVLKAQDLEPEFQNLKDRNGQPITEIYANKGL